MKSPIAVLLTLGLGVVLGFGVTVSLGVRDAVFNSASFDDPVYVATKRSLSTSYKELGNAWLPLDAAAARSAYNESLNIDLLIEMSCPKESTSMANLAYTYGKLGASALALGDYSQAAESFQRSVALLEALDREADEKVEQQQPWPLIVAPTLMPEGFTSGRDLVKRWLTAQRRNLKICQEAQHAQHTPRVVAGG